MRRPRAAALVLPAIVGLHARAVGAQSPAPPAVVVDTVVRLDTLLDLETVVRRAVAASPAVTQARQTVRAARSGERVALGAYTPTLSAQSSALHSSVATNPALQDGPDSYSAGLAASMDVFTGGRRGAERARAAATSGAAEATEVSQRFAVELQARRAFFEALRGRELVEVAKARVARGERGVRYAQDRVRAGTATRSDGLRAGLELTAGRQQLVAALDTLQTAAYALGRLVGAEGPVGALAPASLDPRPLALADSEVVALAVSAAPAVRASRATERAAEQGTRAAHTLYVPTLRVTGGYNWANESVVLGAVRPGWNLALGTSFPLFNGWLREDAVTRADAAEEVARATANDARRQARSEAARLLAALRLAAQNIQLAQEGERAAQEDLRVQTERYRAGISTILDELTSQVALTQAQLGLVKARHDYQLARAALEALVGRAL